MPALDRGKISNFRKHIVSSKVTCLSFLGAVSFRSIEKKGRSPSLKKLSFSSLFSYLAPQRHEQITDASFLHLKANVAYLQLLSPSPAFL